MDHELSQRLQRLLAERTGLRVAAGDGKRFEALLQKIPKTKDSSSFLSLLEQSGPKAQTAWADLAESLAVPETYFFRDAGQMKVLRETLLPEILARGAPPRLWSAGCASGEEIYSLIILLHQLGGDKAFVNSHIVASDISQASLHKARRGLYAEWSFRAHVPAAPYFSRHAEGWEFWPKLRSRVSFQRSNLMEKAGVGEGDFDLILCRNVFIYFEPQAIAQVVDRLYAALRPGGYLLTGHGELHALRDPRWRPCRFADAVVYQRPPSGENPAWVTTPPLSPALSAPAAQCATPVPASAPPCKSKLAQAEAALASGRSALALTLLEEILDGDPTHDRALALAVQTCANQGLREKAQAYCQRALQASPLQSHPYYLLAQLAQADNHPQEAISLLEKALFLDPDLVAAHLELGAIYAQLGQTLRARKQKNAALAILKRMPPGSAIALYEGITAASLAADLAEADDA